MLGDMALREYAVLVVAVDMESLDGSSQQGK